MLLRQTEAPRLLNHLAGVLSSIRGGHPKLFRGLAWRFLGSGSDHLIHAAAYSLRALEDTTDKDVALIRAYGNLSDPLAKQLSLGAIAYMEKFVSLRPQ